MSDWPIPPDQLDLIAELARHEGALGVAITEAAARFHLAGAIAQAAVVQDNDPAYAAELTLWSGRSNGASEGVLAASIPTASGGNDRPSGLRTFPHGTLPQPTGAGHGLPVDNRRHREFGVAVPFGVQVQQEVRYRPLQTCACPAGHDEPRPGGLGGPCEVEDPEPRSPMARGRPVRTRTPA
jgi:hypothetical protein